jgi:hypothetical protein
MNSKKLILIFEMLMGVSVYQQPDQIRTSCLPTFVPNKPNKTNKPF